jgi:hypothetical protein
MFTEAKTQTGHTQLFSAGGLSFYEHGTQGGDVSLLVKYNGKFYYSGLYDMPDTYEAEDLRDMLAESLA